MTTILKRNTNQALGLAHYAREFMSKGDPARSVLNRVKMFHTDSVICGVSALAMKTNAPTVLHKEALELYKSPSKKQIKDKSLVSLFGQGHSIDYKAIAANCSAVREWDSNGTVFGYQKDDISRQAGEFGHNDFYPVVVAAAFLNPEIGGKEAIKAMILLDEIRGRLAESFSLKTYKIDHVVHGAIASIVTYGTLLNATPEQIESAIGMFVAHYIPFRAIRAGHQLSDSKGASAALSTEAAIMSLKRSMNGFVGPKDIFRNPEAIFRLFGKISTEESPFDLHLENEGKHFAVNSMHFKLGLYEHQSAGAIQGVLDILFENNLTEKYKLQDLKKLHISIYQPAFGIIGDPAKRTPHTRQSADHSMVYIISTLIRKAFETPNLMEDVKTTDDLWKKLILLPRDYNRNALENKHTKDLISKIEFEHGGDSYDKDYPRGIPTSLRLEIGREQISTDKIMFPGGHAQNRSADLEAILQNKWEALSAGCIENPAQFITLLNKLSYLKNKKLRKIYDCNIIYQEKSIDE